VTAETDTHATIKELLEAALSTGSMTKLYKENQLEKYDIPGLDRLLKHGRKLRKLWQEAMYPACKTSVNWVTRNIRRTVRKRALEKWDTKLANCEVTLQTLSPIPKTHSTGGGGTKGTIYNSWFLRSHILSN
jgi:hypothetical protein